MRYTYEGQTITVVEVVKHQLGELHVTDDGRAFSPQQIAKMVPIEEPVDEPVDEPLEKPEEIQKTTEPSGHDLTYDHFIGQVLIPLIVLAAVCFIRSLML